MTPASAAQSFITRQLCCNLRSSLDSRAAYTDLFTAFTGAAFESYFGAAENLDDPAMLIAAANRAGLDGAATYAASQTDAVKALLRANTDEVIERGGYGSPSIFVDKTAMYFGNDQLPLRSRASCRERV